MPSVIQPTLVQPAALASPVTVIAPGVVVPPPIVLQTPALGKPAPIPVPLVPVTTAALDVKSGLTAMSVIGSTNGKTESQEELQKKLLDEVEPQTLQQQESLSIKGQSARHLVMQRLMRPRESRVVILRNMVGPEDVDEMLQEEIQEECSKYGSVDRVVIYNEKQSENEDDDAEIIVKIFVEFTASFGKFLVFLLLQIVSKLCLFITIAEAEKAREALNGRYFGGRLVRAEVYDQSLFDHQDYSG